ncbi:hypothetical protein C0995_003569, partial [Termitomyces sp. Mi166
NEREKERLEKEKRGRGERERREREREERERREREEKERREEERQKQEEKEKQEQEERERQEREERERQEREERERQEREKQEKEHARLDRERWEREHWERLETAREKEEREDRERRKCEEEEKQELGKAREVQLQKDMQPEYLQETEAYDHLQPPLNRNSPRPTDSDSSDTCDTDNLELLSPPSAYPIPGRKQSIHERPGDSAITRSIDNPSRLSSFPDRPTARSPPMIWTPSSVEDDVTAKPLSTELGRRNSIASTKSTGSVGVRPSIVDEPIPERSDSEAEYLDEDVRFMEPEGWQSATSKPWERERRREHWKSSASDGPRSDESYAPHFLNPRASHRAEDIKPLPPRDRYDGEQNYRSLRYHRSEEIPSHPPSSVRAPLRREASFHEEFDDKYQPYSASRSIRARTSFEDRGGPYPSFQPPAQGRVPSRPSSTLNDERDYYDQAGYRPYPTPPSSANRSTIRDHMTSPSRYPSGPYGYSGEPRSNTLKYAQQSDSPLSRRPSESRPSLNRGPSYVQNYSEEPSPLHASPSESYSRTYDRAASASIPISVRQHRPPYGAEETEGWKSWSTESPPLRRESRRESERRDRYDQDWEEFQDTEYSSRSGREYEVWHPDSYPYYGPHPEPLRRKSYPMRSPMASHPGSYHDGPDHSFGGRDRTYEALYDNDEFIDNMEEVEPSPRYRDVPRQRREDVQRSALLEEDRNRWEAEDWRRRMAEEEAEHWRLTEEKKRYAYEEEEAQRREAKQEVKKRKETKRPVTEAIRLDDETWQREDVLRRHAEEAWKAKEAAIRIAEEVRIQAEEARRREEEVLRRAREARRKEEEVRRQAEEARREKEEARLKEEEVKRKEEEAKLKEEEVKRKEEEARLKEEEVRRKEVAAKEEARRVREETWKREQEMKYREEELKKREEELRRREKEIEAERLQKEEEDSRKEAERLQKKFDEEEEQRRLEEQKKREEKFRYEQQQEEFRRREQEIHERRRQDSMGGTFASSYASSSTSSARSHPSSSATGINGQTSGWSSSSKPSTTSKASFSASTASKSRSGSMNASFPASTPSPHPPPSFDEAEFKRRQEEFLKQQQERFRKEQQRFEETRQRTESNKLSSEQVLSILERHDRQWNILISSATSLHWGSIPWPMFFPPQSPEDITLSAVTTYLQSPLLPDREKAKPQKDRLKEMIKKWHPDRFETKYLPRIIEGDREKVKEGTGVVIRSLNELLTKVNTPGPFGSS